MTGWLAAPIVNRPQAASLPHLTQNSCIVLIRGPMKKLIPIAIALFGITPLFAEDWLQFRGPNSAGVSENRNLPVEFGPNKNVVWKTDVPPGYSSPVLVG